jgi:hypothetical protein
MSKHLSHPLWQPLYAFHPDKPGVAMPFSRRLAIENGWPRRYTLRVIEEYKRFVFMAVTSGQSVTPSEAVDQTWHLHLVYTRSYWEDFCGNVLQRPLHHQPTEGGTQEDEKYRERYQQTLDLYTETFGSPPPRDIWLPVEQRFAGGLWRWINRKHFWVISKPAFLRG